MNAHPTSALVEAVAQWRAVVDVSELPQRWPREGIAAALIVDRFGNEHVEPIIVKDFYRSAADAND
jgi:hypothetical protein